MDRDNAALIGGWGMDDESAMASFDRDQNATLVGSWGRNREDASAGPSRRGNPALVGAWAKVSDSDGDGVADDQDRCPDTPQGVSVDLDGCPLDADSDGVPDGLDQCANTPRGARVDARGCPSDTDGDGVPDGIDQCANTPAGAPVNARGCPSDADGDGVPDGIDRCADTPRGATIDASGCPSDTDRDGVPDGIDECANTPSGSRVDGKGCPLTEAQARFVDTGSIALPVQFDSNKATIKSESNEILDRAGEFLTRYPDLRCEVSGHTDSQGADDHNQQLSEQRAQAVVDYLVNKYPSLKRGNFPTRGFGETKPIADNKTAAGRSQNRRVEFKALNPEVMK